MKRCITRNEAEDIVDEIILKNFTAIPLDREKFVDVLASTRYPEKELDEEPPIAYFWREYHKGRSDSFFYIRRVVGNKHARLLSKTEGLHLEKMLVRHMTYSSRIVLMRMQRSRQVVEMLQQRAREASKFAERLSEISADAEEYRQLQRSVLLNSLSVLAEHEIAEDTGYWKKRPKLLVYSPSEYERGIIDCFEKENVVRA